MSRIAILGAGAWGTALAIVLTRDNRHTVSLWAYEPEVRDSITQQRENALYLPGLKIPAAVTTTNNYAEALEGADTVVSVMPTNHCRRVFQEILPHLTREMLLVSATKGIEETSHLRMSEVICDVVQKNK